MRFVPLHVYSGFSYLQSALTAEKLPFLAKKHSFERIALTDNGTMSGYAPFFHSSNEAGIAPLFGMDLKIEGETFTLFAKNEAGYRNLLKMTLFCSKEDLKVGDLNDHAEGLVLVYSPDPLFFGRLDINETKIFAESLFKKISSFYDSFIAIPYCPDNPNYADKLRSFASLYSYETVAFPLLRYEKKQDAIALEILSAIQKNISLEIKEKEGNDYFLSEKEINDFFLEKEIANTMKIADLLEFTILKKRGGLLRYENGEGLSSDEYLRKLAYEGMHRKCPNDSSQYADRLDYELSIIKEMGYSDYFLIVMDYVRWAKNNGVTVGPGRGSGAASLVSYCLDIVSLDPVKYGLIFESFLNPERQSMPDIDVDFSDVGRERVVSYIQEKYGSERVGHVLTTQTILTKQAIRDVGRVYGYDDKKEVSPLIDSLLYPSKDLRFNYRHSPQFKKKIDSDSYYLQLVSLASKIEGLPRQAGLHAAGVVINDLPLPEVIPTTFSPEVGYVACLEKDYLEEQGFLKMDILGLRNLTIVDECLFLIEKYQKKRLSYAELPYDDQESIKIISEDRVMGLFQLESGGMRRVIREVVPTSFDDVAALLALFRPGPMKSIPSFARRKHGEEKIEYLAPELEPILKDTYGIIVYQEQIMQIVREMAGFSYGQADLFRRAISKKEADRLTALKDNFIAGCLKNGKTPELAEKVYDLIFRFANYGFKKAHAYSYGVLTCQMAYLKVHYPKEFYCAILDSMSPGDAKFANTISELKKRGLKLVVPDVNSSSSSFVIDGSSIRFPLSMIKSLQNRFINEVIDEREARGNYLDIFDFAARNRRNGLNIQTLIKMIDAGSFDSFSKSRASLRAAAPGAMKYSEMVSGEDGQQFLIDLEIEKPVIPDVMDDIRSNLELEYEALGMMVSGSPLSLYEKELEDRKIPPLAELEEGGYEVRGAGIIKSLRSITTRSGKKMAFVQLYDTTGEREFVIFSEAYEKNYIYLKNDAVIIFKAHKGEKKDGSLIIDEIEPLEEK